MLQLSELSSPRRQLRRKEESSCTFTFIRSPYFPFVIASRCQREDLHPEHRALFRTTSRRLATVLDW